MYFVKYLDMKNNFSYKEDYQLLGYNAVQSVECQPMFRRNISPLSSGRKNKLRKKPASMQVASRLHGVISQKLILFITTAVKTSNPTQL
jgi:hypothetical protein